jgi:hypothetical protein
MQHNAQRICRPCVLAAAGGTIVLGLKLFISRLGAAQGDQVVPSQGLHLSIVELNPPARIA